MGVERRRRGTHVLPESAHQLRTGKPPVNAIVFWRGGKHGHVAIQTVLDRVWTVDRPVNGRIGWVKRSDIHDSWGYIQAGWCYAEDVPGWTK